MIVIDALGVFILGAVVVLGFVYASRRPRSWTKRSRVAIPKEFESTFEEGVKPLIAMLRQSHNPKMTVVISAKGAKLVEGDDTLYEVEAKTQA